MTHRYYFYRAKVKTTDRGEIEVSGVITNNKALSGFDLHEDLKEKAGKEFNVKNWGKDVFVLVFNPI